MSTINNTPADNLVKMVYDHAINAHRHQIEVLGLELQHASGVRAIAAEEIIRKRGGWGHIDGHLLFDACDELIGNDRLFESYDDSCNPNAGEGFVLGEGCPFMSLEAYLDLHELFGDDWLAIALVQYGASWGDEGLWDHPLQKSAALVDRARDEFDKACTMKFRRFSDQPARFEAVV